MIQNKLEGLQVVRALAALLVLCAHLKFVVGEDVSNDFQIIKTA